MSYLNSMRPLVTATVGPVGRRRGVTAAVVLATSLASAAPLVAQNPAPKDQRTVTPADTAHKAQQKTLFTYRDALLAGGFAVLTVIMFPADQAIAKKLTDSSLTTNRFFQHSASGLEGITAPGAYIIGGGLYAVGRLAHKPNVADLGWHGTESVILATAITGVLKGTMGRARPFVTNDTNPADFRIGGGFGDADRQSFPSGHTTTAFAVASSVTSETRRLYPNAVKFVAPVMYGGATLVGLSRMYHNKHWASDVVLGAGIGTFSGIKVVRYSHAHPHNKVDRVILGTTIAMNGQDGVALGFTFPAP
jgi:membrane-associated phospholipid phosphatase